MFGIVLFCFTMAAMTSVLEGQVSGGPTHGKVVVCYIATWAAYRPGGGKFEQSNLEPSLCTHLVYSFAGLDESTNSIKSLDPWQDLEKDYGKAGYKRLVTLKQRYPHLKVTVAIGGWNEGSEKYSRMASKPETRSKICSECSCFSQELKQAFEPYDYILTAALGAGKETMDSAYELGKLSRYLDLIHMMCYDYHGTWDRLVGANAPLRGTDEEDVLSVEYTIKYLLSHGVSPYKMVLGLPMYGRSFILTNPDVRDIQFGLTPTLDTGFEGPWTKEKGFMGYNEICMEMTNKSSKWTRHWDTQSATPFLRDGKRVIVYDNPRSIAVKIKMAIDYGLGGLMVWSIDTDDYDGLCEPEPDTYLDFVERYNDIASSPLLQEALKNLHLPDANRIENLSRRTSYVASNNKLYLRLPEDEYSNYPLMRTINEATIIAMEEKKILDEMDRVVKENEIKPKDDKDDKDSSNSVVANFAFVCFPYIYSYVLMCFVDE